MTSHKRLAARVLSQFPAWMTTVRTIITQVCSAIWTKMKDICLREPTEEEWKTITEMLKKTMHNS
jgi:hypothetical protein